MLARLLCESLLVKQREGYSVKVYRLWESWTVLQTACWQYCKAVPQSTCHLNGAQPCEAMRMAKSCKEVMAAYLRSYGSEGHRFNTWSQQGLFAV